MSPAALSLLTVVFEEGQERNRALGIWAAITAGGAALGLILGGVLTEYASWRWVLFVNVPIAVVAVVGALRFVPGEPRRARARLRRPRRGPRHRRPDGARLRAGQGQRATAGARRQTVADPRARRRAARRASSLVQRRARDPLVPFRLFRSRSAARRRPRRAVRRRRHLRASSSSSSCGCRRSTATARSRPASRSCR